MPAPPQPEEVQGSVERVVFRNEDTGFAVIQLQRLGSREHLTLVGTMAAVQVGERLHCKGAWAEDRRFGKQFKVEWFDVQMPDTLAGLERYLASGVLRGIGPATAKRIVDYFGHTTFDVLDECPERLKELPGIGPKTYERILNSLLEHFYIRNLVVWLQNYGVSPAYARRIYRHYGEESTTVVRQNPYALAAEVIGIGFKTADRIARAMGIAEDDPRRLAAAAEHIFHHIAQQGHTCYPFEALPVEAERELGIGEETIRLELQRLCAEGAAVLRDVEGRQMVWNRYYYQMEQSIAQKIRNLLHGIEPTLEALRSAPLAPIRAIAEGLGICLEEQQEQAVLGAARLPIFIVTGGPGTGKSTIIKTLTRYLESLGQEFLLAAPTGRAAKRLSEITGREALTVHSLLGFGAGQTTAYAANAFTARLNADVLIVDEASMLDTALLAGICRALGPNTRLVLVGDVDQLPSVGAGYVLGDCLDCQSIPIVRLTEIFRQAAGSDVITNAHRIRRGERIDLSIRRNSDFFVLRHEETADLQNTLLSLLGGRLHKTYGWDMCRDVQVLSPMNKGELGTVRLNELIQQCLNPPAEDKAQLERGKSLFRVGDKLLQTRNNYDKGVFNGDIGTVERIDPEERMLWLRVDDSLVEYKGEDLQELELAYAISVHKFQGSECPCVLVVLHTSHYLLLSRNLLYTAVTRGKKLVVLLGSERAINTAIDKQNDTRRYTGLRQALSQDTGLGEIVLVEMPEPDFLEWEV